jgi:hypothetical protein
MGFPSKTEIEAYTDDVAARLAANLVGFRTEYQPRTVVTLFDLVDASADPDVQNALGPAAFDLDEQSLPENLATALLNASAGLAYRPKYRAFLEALSNLAKSAAGGAHTNLEAALFARAAVIHPLAAEVERSRASEGGVHGGRRHPDGGGAGLRDHPAHPGLPGHGWRLDGRERGRGFARGGGRPDPGRERG